MVEEWKEGSLAVDFVGLVLSGEVKEKGKETDKGDDSALGSG